MPKLTIQVTDAMVEAIDGNPDHPSDAECPWVAGVAIGDCSESVVDTLWFQLNAWKVLPNGGYVTLRFLEWTARLNGWRDHWQFNAGTSGQSDVAVLDSSSFEFDPDVDQAQGQHGRARLYPPITMAVPLGLVVALGAGLAPSHTRHARIGSEWHVHEAFVDPPRPGGASAFSAKRPTQSRLFS